MEENSNMTAERSLEIITQQIERSRRAVSKTLGQSLFISGICIMCTAVLVVVINVMTVSHGMVEVGHVLWFLLPVVIWQLSRRYIKVREHAPASFVGTMVAKTWMTFGVFGIGFFVIALIWGWLAGRLMPLSEIPVIQIRVAPVIVLLMGMAITMNGHILRQRWLVWFGIVAGLLCSVWEYFQMGSWVLLHVVPMDLYATAAVVASLPCLTIFIFAFVGLLLPGMMLKKQSV